MKVGAAHLLEDSYDLVELWVNQTQVKHLQVSGAIGPVLDLIKRARVVVAGLGGVLVGDELLNLTRPVDDDRLQALQQVLVLDGGVDVAQVLVGNVQVLHALGNVAGLCDHSHKAVQVGDELLLDVVRPLVLSEELGAGLVHHAEQLIKRISVANATDDELLDVASRDPLIRLPLDEVGDLVVLNFHLGFCSNYQKVRSFV